MEVWTMKVRLVAGIVAAVVAGIGLGPGALAADAPPAQTAIGIVHDDHHFAALQIGDHGFDRVKPSCHRRR